MMNYLHGWKLENVQQKIQLEELKPFTVEMGLFFGSLSLLQKFPVLVVVLGQSLTLKKDYYCGVLVKKLCLCPYKWKKVLIDILKGLQKLLEVLKINVKPKL